MEVTRGWLPQRAGSTSLKGGGETTVAMLNMVETSMVN